MIRTVNLFLGLALFAPLGLAESPTTGVCDSTGKLVCAGADAGAAVNCSLDGLVASCSWTRGAIWTAYSPVGLPGDSAAGGGATLMTCVAGSCVSESFVDDDSSCSWVAILSCDGHSLASGSVGPVTLALGQCYLVELTQTVHIEASVIAGVASVANAAWTSQDHGAGQVCLVDDGR